MADVEKESAQPNGDVEKNPKSKNGESDKPTDLEIKIIEQIEYYFGDYSLPRDKFLQLEIKKDDGWVPLEVLLTFNRLSRLTTESEVITTALKKSKSGLIEVSEDNTKVRRCPSFVLPEMNEARRQELVSRSVYVKGFPLEKEMDTLLEFFKEHIKVDQLIMRKYLDKATKTWIFKGSVFAVFSSKEVAEQFVKLAPLKFEDKDLIIKLQKDYIEEKKQERLENRSKHLKEKRKQKDEDDEDGDEEEKKGNLPKGASLYLSDCPDTLTREELKTKIEELGIAIAFVYFSKGEKEGWIRLQEPNSASEVIKHLTDNKLVLKDESSVTIKAIEGEEEEKFLGRAKEDMARRKNRNKVGGNRARRGRKPGGGGNWRKRRGSPNKFDEDQPSKKIAHGGE